MAADLTGADLSDAFLLRNPEQGLLFHGNSERTSLARQTRTNLAAANLKRANLTNADLTGADLEQADLTDAVLTGVVMCSERGRSPALLHNAILRGITFGPRTTQTRTRQGQTDGPIGLIEIAASSGLETVVWPDLTRYLAAALEEARNPNLASNHKWPEVVAAATRRIGAIRSLLSQADAPPQQLVEVVGLASKELVKHLKRHPEELRRIKPRQFEELVAEILEAFGWTVMLTPATDDGGYDILGIVQDANGQKQSWIIECKKYAENNKVEVDIVRSLYGIRNTMKVNGAMLATTSDFTKGAREFQKNARLSEGSTSRYHFDLRNYTSVLEWINEYQPHEGGDILIKNDRLWVPGDDDVPTEP